MDGIVRRIKREWPTGREPLVVATGGLATVLVAHCEEIDLVDQHLTLDGLRLMWELAQ